MHRTFQYSIYAILNIKKGKMSQNKNKVDPMDLSENEGPF